VTDDETGNARGSGTAASDAIVDAGPEHRPTMTTELLRAEAGDVRAESVSMERAGAERVTAERVVMTNSGARTVETRSAQVDRSGILTVKSEKAVFSNSSIVAAKAEQVRIGRSAVFALKADNATIEGDTRVAVYAGPANASIRPVVDIGGAAAFGAACGATFVILGAILRRIFRARS
jgi:hypothetical protein